MQHATNIGKWERVQDSYQRVFYINHHIRQTSWQLPVQATLPDGWQEIHNEYGHSFFANHNTSTTTWIDPRLSSSNLSPKCRSFKSGANSSRISLCVENHQIVRSRTARVSQRQTDSFRRTPIILEQVQKCSPLSKANDTYFTSSQSTEHLTRRFIAPVFEREEINICRHCSNRFSVLRRRHHCRLCGCIHCSDCLSNKVKLPLPNSVEYSADTMTSRLQCVCTRCHRNIVNGNYISIVGLRYCLSQSEREVSLFTFEEHMDILKQLSDTFKRPREESASGMGSHQIAQLNDIEAAGGIVAFCELLYPTVDAWIASPSKHTEQILCEVLELLTLLFNLAQLRTENGSNPNTASEGFADSEIIPHLIRLLTHSHHAIEQSNVERISLNFVYYLMDLKRCREMWNTLHGVSPLILLMYEQDCVRPLSIRITSTECLYKFIHANVERTLVFVSLSGMQALWYMLYDLIQDTQDGENTPERIKCVLEMLDMCLTKKEISPQSSMCVVESGGRRETMEEVLKVGSETVTAQIPENAFSSVMAVFAHQKSSTELAVRVCKAICKVPDTLQAISEPDCNPNLTILLEMLQGFLSATSRDAEDVEMPLYLMASDVISDICSIDVEAPHTAGIHAWKLFLAAMYRHRGLHSIIKIVFEIGQRLSADVSLMSRALVKSFAFNLLQILYSYTRASDVSYLELLCGMTPDASVNYLHTLCSFLLSPLCDLPCCADLILSILEKAPDVSIAWRNFCNGDSQTETALIRYFEIGLSAQDDANRQRISVQFFLTYLSIPEYARQPEKEFPDSILNLIIHLIVHIGDPALRVQCLDILLKAFQTLPSKHAHMHENLTDQACFVSFMQIFCAPRYTSIANKRIRRYLSSSYLLSLPSVSFVSSSDQNHSQWAILRCLETLVPDAAFLEEPSKDEEPSSDILSVRQQSARLVRRMMDISVLQAFSTALWNVLVSLSQDVITIEDIGSMQVWCEAILALLERILKLLDSSLIARKERFFVDLIRVVLFTALSPLLIRETPAKKALVNQYWRIISVFFTHAAWRARFTTLLREEPIHEVEEELRNTETCVQFLHLLMKQLQEESWIIESLNVLKLLFQEMIPSKKSFAHMKVVLSRIHFPAFVQMVLEKLEGQIENTRPFQLLLEILEVALHCPTIRADIADKGQVLRCTLHQYFESDEHDVLGLQAGNIIILLSECSQSFRRIIEESQANYSEKIVHHAARRFDAHVDEETRNIYHHVAEIIILNLSGSDSNSCPLWKKIMDTRDVELLTAVTHYTKNFQIQHLIANKLLNLITIVLSENDSDAIHRLRDSLKRLLNEKKDWMAPIVSLLCLHETEKEMSRTAFRTLVTVISLNNDIMFREEEKSDCQLLDYAHRQDLATRGAASLSFWLQQEESQEQMQYEIVSILFDGIRAQELRAHFYKQISEENISRANLHYLTNALTRHILTLSDEYWVQKDMDEESAFKQYIQPICKRCVLVCECLRYMDSHSSNYLSSKDIPRLVSISTSFLKWIDFASNVDTVSHSFIITILEVLTCETGSLELCRELVKLDTIAIVVSFVQNQVVNGNQTLIFQSLDLLKMLCIVDLGKFLQCKGIEMLLQLVDEAIDKNYNCRGSRMAAKALQLFTFIHKKSTIAAKNPSIIWENESVVLTVDRCIVALQSRLQTLHGYDAVELNAAYNVQRSERFWLDVLRHFIIFKFNCWARRCVDMYEDTVARRITFEFLTWMGYVFQTESAQIRLNWNGSKYRELMCTALSVIGKGLAKCHDPLIFEETGYSISSVLDVAITQTHKASEADHVGILLCATCSCLSTLFSHPYSVQQLFDVKRIASINLMKLEYFHKIFRRLPKQAIACLLDAVAYILPFVTLGDRYNWIPLWITEILQELQSSKKWIIVITPLLNALYKCCSRESLVRIITEPDRFAIIVKHLEWIVTDSVNGPMALKILQTINAPPWDLTHPDIFFSDTNSLHSSIGHVALLVRCYNCQQPVHFDTKDVFYYNQVNIPPCTYCQQPFAVIPCANQNLIPQKSQSQMIDISPDDDLSFASHRSDLSPSSIANVNDAEITFQNNDMDADASTFSAMSVQEEPSESDVDTMQEEKTRESSATNMMRCDKCATLLCVPCDANAFKCMNCFETTWL